MVRLVVAAMVGVEKVAVEEAEVEREEAVQEPVRRVVEAAGVEAKRGTVAAAEGRRGELAGVSREEVGFCHRQPSWGEEAAAAPKVHQRLQCRLEKMEMVGWAARQVAVAG